MEVMKMWKRGIFSISVFTVILLSLSLALAFPVIEPQRILSEEGWQEEYDNFVVEKDLIKEFTSALENQDAVVEVYFAFWCPDCKRELPRFLKIINMAEMDLENVTFFEVERKSSGDQKYYFEEKQVTSIPTFVLITGGKEKGRIVESPKTGLTEDLIKILK